jgi:hypothetical protein
LRNHAPEIAAMDFFVVPTIGFDLLYAFVIVRIDRRDLVWINVTKNPTAEWVARQITEAFPWDGAPDYMIRDRDRIYAASSRIDCVPWAFGTSLLHRLVVQTPWLPPWGGAVSPPSELLMICCMRANRRAWASVSVARS